MNTKTMRLPPRRVLTPSSTTSNKRKERDGPFDRPKPIPAPTSTKLLKPDKPTSRLGSEPITSKTTCRKGSEPMPSNQLLAGYLAHEFLTKGSLLGEPWVPPRGKSKDEEDGGEEGGEATEAPCRRPEMKMERERYVEVTGLLKSGGTHLRGVVNPTQLARFLHL